MSTHSYVGYYDNQTKKITYIYCHYDGYPSYNGKILYHHYTDSAKIKQLLDLGNLSILGKNIGIARPFGIKYNLLDLNDYENLQQANQHTKLTDSKFEAEQEITDFIRYLKVNPELNIGLLLAQKRVIWDEQERIHLLVSLAKDAANYKSAPVLRLTQIHDLNQPLSEGILRHLQSNLDFLVANKRLSWSQIFEIIDCENSCLFYGRDGEEEGCEAKTSDPTDYCQYLVESRAEYAYLYKGGLWLMAELTNYEQLSLEDFRPLEPKDFAEPAITWLNN